MKKIITLRHFLHQNPELSNKEYKTSKIIIDTIQKYFPDEIIQLNNTGLAFIYKSNEEGNTIMFRAELDALPITEKNNIKYISKKKGVAHSCGHDGHMAILVRLAQKISKNPPKKGKVVLLFQPAEEVGQGAKDIVDDCNFQKIKPDYIFALHNIPGVKKNTILVKTDSFSASSKGMIVKLLGKTSHAAEPHYGINPTIAISKIIKKLNALNNNKKLFKDFILLTVVYIKLGENTFGISPGYAELHITFRAYKNKDMKLLSTESEKIIAAISKEEKLKYTISFCEIFPAIVNDKECVKLIIQSADENNLEVKTIDKPFDWSEDFSYYTEKFRGGFFGLGAGIETPTLHNPNYDFPDDIIEAGSKMFFSIYKFLNL